MPQPRVPHQPWFRRRPRLASGLGTLVLAAAGLAAAVPAGRAASPTPAQLQALEAALNSSETGPLAALLEAGPGLDPQELEKRRSGLRRQFPDLRWQLSAGAPRRDGQATVNLRLTGSRRQGATTYRLQAEQLLSLQSNGQRINGQTVLGESSILRSGDPNLPITLQIPDTVLTGQRYDVDVILDEPLDDALAAGGLAAVNPQQLLNQASPGLEIGVLGGGGLFKRVQAPFTPGFQTWAVLLVHPRGIISTTKRVRVVADRSAL